MNCWKMDYVDGKGLAGPGVVGAGAIGRGLPGNDDIVGVQAGAVMEEDAFAQVEGPDRQAIVRSRPMSPPSPGITSTPPLLEIKQALR